MNYFFFCSVNLHFFYEPTGSIIQKGINDCLCFPPMTFLALCPPLPPKVLLVPWGCQLSGRAQSWGNAYTLRPVPHLHGKQMCLMFGIVTILQYNAAVLLRHESVVFKNLSSFLKLPFCFNMPLFSIFQVDVFLLQQSFGMS